MAHNTPIIVGLSGGVDSAVSALLLKQQGYQVEGVFMQNWEAERDDPYCSAEQDLSDAQAIADQIGIPLHTANFSKDYWQRVFQHCLDQFARGLTPNPDILCNREIKFNVFLNYVKQHGAHTLATGHYARVKQQDGQYQLLKGLDPNKDQSYFLYTLGQEALAHCCFPLGELEKTSVRDIAASHGLINHAKKDSTGVCFIGERKFKPFLQEFILAQPGPIKALDGHTLGQHDGIMFYTIGQRKGLELGGQKNYSGGAWYVAEKDIENNTLLVVDDPNHPLLFKQELMCDDLHWISGTPPTQPLHYTAKTRYRQSDQACQLELVSGSRYRVRFEQAQRAVTPGQSIVFYQQDQCLGGAIIT